MGRQESAGTRTKFSQKIKPPTDIAMIPVLGRHLKNLWTWRDACDSPRSSDREHRTGHAGMGCGSRMRCGRQGLMASTATGQARCKRQTGAASANLPTHLRYAHASRVSDPSDRIKNHPGRRGQRHIRRGKRRAAGILDGATTQ